jgi:hypothetical protein
MVPSTGLFVAFWRLAAFNHTQLNFIQSALNKPMKSAYQPNKFTHSTSWNFLSAYHSFVTKIFARKSTRSAPHRHHEARSVSSAHATMLHAWERSNADEI